MDKQKKHRLPRRFFTGLLSLLLGLLLIGLIYVGAALLHSPELEEGIGQPAETPMPVTPLQPGVTGNERELQRLFGLPLPYLPGHSFSGSAENALHDGAAARRAILQYEGFRITALQPAAAAGLLLYPELSISLRSDLIVLGCPAMLAEKGAEKCVYFATPQAAFAVYAPQAEEEAFLSLLSLLKWTEE